MCMGGNEKERKNVENILFFQSLFHMTNDYLNTHIVISI